MDYGIHPPDRINLICNASRLDGAAEIANHDLSCAPRKICQRFATPSRSRVQNHIVSAANERFRSGAAQAIRASCYEYPRHFTY
jgi:hypothetical protein